MRVRDVQVENFRAFQSAEMRLPGSGLVLVAGANNAGKTALLSAFDAIAGDNGDVTSLRHGGSEEPARLWATFDLDEAERTAILENATGGQTLLNTGVLHSLQFAYEQWADQGLKVHEVLGSWPSLGLQPLARMRPYPPSGQYTYEVIRAFPQGGGQEAQPAPVPDVSGEALRELTSTNTYGPGEGGLDSFLRGQPVWAPMIAWRSRFHHFRALRTGTQRSQQLSSPEKLDPAGSNLASVLHYLATDRRHLFERARELIAQVVPDIGTLQVRTGGNNMRVVFDSGVGDLNLKDLGTGVEQLLMTLVVGLTEAPPFTLLIEGAGDQPEPGRAARSPRPPPGLGQRPADHRRHA